MTHRLHDPLGHFTDSEDKPAVSERSISLCFCGASHSRLVIVTVPDEKTAYCSSAVRGYLDSDRSGGLDKCLTGHSCRLLDAHQLEDGRSNVCELSVLDFLHLVTCVHNDERYVVE